MTGDCSGLRVAGFGLRGENQTNPKSEIQNRMIPTSAFCPLSSVLCHLSSFFLSAFRIQNSVIFFLSAFRIPNSEFKTLSSVLRLLIDNLLPISQSLVAFDHNEHIFL